MCLGLGELEISNLLIFILLYMELFECHHDISGDTWCKLYRSWLQASSYLSAFFFEVVYSLRTSRQS
jgi:hypothetical protein